jgi:hypothetical protein
MALQAMRFDRRRWSAVCDLRGVVHHGTRLTKKEAQYLFCLAGAVRAIVACGECGAAAGAWCVRKLDGKSMANHSYRVRQAKLLFEQRILSQLGRVHRTLCSAPGNFPFIIFGPAQDRAVDCMACLVAAARQGG